MKGEIVDDQHRQRRSEHRRAETEEARRNYDTQYKDLKGIVVNQRRQRPQAGGRSH